MKPFVYTEPAGGETLWMQPGDAWAVSNNHDVFAVADSPLRYLTAMKRDYPYDDFGGHFARLFCSAFIEESEKYLSSSSMNEDSMSEILRSVNQSIREENERIGKVYNDPENYDMGEVVATGVAIQGDVLYYGLLEDCYVNVLRGEDLVDQVKLDYQINKATQEVDRLSKAGKLKEYASEEILELLPADRDWEPVWCNHLRNNFEAINDNGEMVGWGIFNGEEQTEQFFQIGSVRLEPGDHILVFTDGMLDILEDEEMLRWILDNAESKATFHRQMRKRILDRYAGSWTPAKEKTLIYKRWLG